MIYWGSSWKRKKTGEIVTLVCISRGSGGDFVRIIGGDGISAELEEKVFEKNYEQVTLDYHAVKDQMAELCYLSDSFGKLGRVVMRRLDPKYFEVGKLVYISNTVILKRDDITYYGGPEHPYIIKWIKPKTNPYSDDMFLEVGIRLARKTGGGEDEVDYTFPIYLTRPNPEDACWFLSRYDKPY